MSPGFNFPLLTIRSRVKGVEVSIEAMRSLCMLGNKNGDDNNENVLNVIDSN